MAKPKLSLTVAPTFKATVEIPVAGSMAAEVEFIFKHRTRDNFAEWLDALRGTDNVDALLDIASGWDLDDPFDAASIGTLEQNYMGAVRAAIDKYIAELTGARTKN